ncbi:hypothetical protein G9444_6748 (plasmid) [Rhodococcus erythropolis]|uniref:Uncharacterized protein n=1 Tax=Rhodococcus erythropolis TaxID=1833 RepID=A0A6G9D584_RHOER|nr:hypothetical protein G9444_6748 [Rhodococcus erythropolis]
MLKHSSEVQNPALSIPALRRSRDEEKRCLLFLIG